mmetsp:Transcript_8241/g.15659  ORF Transcript_8241/g.15659 Transcript_8241/m.15659 type:complete len:201 (+) Transcript_8241:573-1175(+)
MRSTASRAPCRASPTASGRPGPRRRPSSGTSTTGTWAPTAWPRTSLASSRSTCPTWRMALRPSRTARASRSTCAPRGARRLTASRRGSRWRCRRPVRFPTTASTTTRPRRRCTSPSTRAPRSPRRCASTRRTWACPARSPRCPRTSSLRATWCRAQRRWATTPSSSWPSRSTPSTDPSATTSPTFSLCPPAAARRTSSST